MNKQTDEKILHDLTACRFCEDINVIWKITLTIDKKPIEYSCCDVCVDYIPYLDKLPISNVWDKIKVERLVKSYGVKPISSDYFIFMEDRANNKLIRKNKQNGRNSG